MPLRKDSLVDSGNGSQNGHTAMRFHNGAHHGFMTRPADPVQDHTPDRYIGIKLLTTDDHGGHRSSRPGAIRNEDQRRPQQLGQFRRAVASVSVHAVEKAPVPLHQHAIRFPCNGRKGRNHPSAFHQKKIQIVAWIAGRHFQPSRIDIIGTLFERKYLLASPAKARSHAHGQEGLSRISPESGENHPGTVNNHFPALSLITHCLPLRAGCRHLSVRTWSCCRSTSTPAFRPRPSR